MKTILLHALAKGERRDYMATLICDRPDTEAGRTDIAKARAWAKSQGFHHFTESRIQDGALPDFFGAIQGEHQ